MNAARSSAPPKVSPLLRSALAQRHLSDLAVSGDRVARLCRGHQCGGESGASSASPPASASGTSTAGFDISQTLIPYTTRSTYGRAFWVGLAEHAAGFRSRHRLRDRARLCDRRRCSLSKNWLVARLAAGYVEVDPQPAAAAAIAVLVQRRAEGAAGACATASRSPAARFSTTAGCSCRSRFSGRASRRCRSRLVVGIVGAFAFRVWARRRQMATGQQAPVLWRQLGC